MKSIAIAAVAALILAGIASTASAQCANGVCQIPTLPQTYVSPVPSYPQTIQVPQQSITYQPYQLQGVTATQPGWVLGQCRSNWLNRRVARRRAWGTRYTPRYVPVR